MHGQNRELVQARQQDLARETRNRRWAGELQGGRRRNGTLWIFRLPRREILLSSTSSPTTNTGRDTGCRGLFRCSQGAV